MAHSAESHRQSRSDVRAGDLRICSGPVVVTGGYNSLGDAHRGESLRHCSAIQCTCRDRIVSCRRLDGYVTGHSLPLDDLAWGRLSER